MSSQHPVVETPSVPEPPPPSASRRPRCSHISCNGLPCRYSAEPGSDRCKHHLASTPSAQPDDALAEELLAAAGSLSSPADVNRLIRSVLQALVQRRLSAKEAGILCYIAQTSLHSQRAIARQQQLEAEAQQQQDEDEDDDGPPKLTWNLPPPAWIESHPVEYAELRKRIEKHAPGSL